MPVANIKIDKSFVMNMVKMPPLHNSMSSRSAGLRGKEAR